MVEHDLELLILLPLLPSSAGITRGGPTSSKDSTFLYCFSSYEGGIGLGIISLRSLIEMRQWDWVKRRLLVRLPGFTQLVMGRAFPVRMSLFIAFSLLRSRKISALAAPERAES